MEEQIHVSYKAPLGKTSSYLVPVEGTNLFLVHVKMRNSQSALLTGYFYFGLFVLKLKNTDVLYPEEKSPCLALMLM
jgi:hypothetical protein